VSKSRSAWSSTELARKVRECVLEESGAYSKLPKLDATTDLIGSGLLDSVGVFQVIARLELELGIQVRDEEIQIGHFETLGRLTELIASKVAA
jgi:acyl carrier protein